MFDSVSYESFQSSNGGFANDNGPWRLQRSSPEDVNSGSLQPSWCQDVTYCLSAWVFPSSSQPSYTVSFFTKLAVNLTQYGGATALDYEWQYLPWWGSTKSVVGSSLDMKSNVGADVYTDKLQVGNFTELFTTGQGWDYAPFKHSGTINLEANAGTTTGYVRLAINLTFPRQDAEYINYYVKGASFKITTPTIPVTNSSTTPIFNGSSTGSSESGSNKISTGALIGGILGAAAVVAFIMISFVYIWKRTNKQAKYGDTTMVEAMAEAGPYTTARLPPSPTPFTIDNHGYTHNGPAFVIPVIDNNNSRTFSEPRSISPDQTSTSAITDTMSLGPAIDHPPAYNDSRSPRTQHVNNRGTMSANWVTFSKR
ncbi:hypothetical protein FRC19_008851 [Serendipita sp. 401]|nr:hypothetical protein FRC19_008851 [Serendipita sp. 401]